MSVVYSPLCDKDRQLYLTYLRSCDVAYGCGRCISRGSAYCGVVDEGKSARGICDVSAVCGADAGVRASDDAASADALFVGAGFARHACGGFRWRRSVGSECRVATARDIVGVVPGVSDLYGVDSGAKCCDDECELGVVADGKAVDHCNELCEDDQGEKPCEIQVDCSGESGAGRGKHYERNRAKRLEKKKKKCNS